MKFSIFFFILLLLPLSNALSVSGGPMPADSFYEANTQKEYTYKFGTHSVLQDYRIYLSPQTEYDITPFMKVEPTFFSNMPPGTGAEFKVTMDFFETEVPPGMHDALVVVSETKTPTGGAVGAKAEVAVRFRIISLYPTEYLAFSIGAKDANTGEEVDLVGRVSNWGVPDLDGAKIRYKIYDSQLQLVKEAESETFSIKSKERKEIITTIQTDGFLPDDYKIIGKLSYLNEELTKERSFRLGSKNIKIIDITRNYLPNAINKAEITVESDWNNVIDEVEGIVKVSYEGTVVKEFSLIEISLDKWDKTNMNGYFETSGLELGDYEAEVVLSYDEEKSAKKFDITIAEDSSTETVEQLPGSFNASSLFSLQNIILVLLVIILGMNVWYLMDRRKK